MIIDAPPHGDDSVSFSFGGESEGTLFLKISENRDEGA